MADTKMIPISPDFNMVETVEKLTQMYQTKGFDVAAVQMGEGYSINFSKDEDGIKKFTGLGLEITANLSISNNTLIISFTDAEWTGKIIGFAVGWFLCLIPCFTAGYGALKQSDLPKTIAKDIQVIMTGGAAPFGGVH